MNISLEPRKSVFRTVPQAVMGPLFRHNESVRDQTSCKVNVGKNEVHLTSIYSPQLLKNCFCFGPSTRYLFANHKEPQRSTECPRCPCNVSAAVAAKIMLKSTMHMCQLSSCHLKVRRARVWKEIWSCLTLFKFARVSKHCGVADCPSG